MKSTDAGYGSFNNYLYCEEHGMKKYMKFTMFKKECEDKSYREDPYRAVNFPINENGNPVCPNGKEFHYLKTRPVRGNKYGKKKKYINVKIAVIVPTNQNAVKQRETEQSD